MAAKEGDQGGTTQAPGGGNFQQGQQDQQQTQNQQQGGGFNEAPGRNQRGPALSTALSSLNQGMAPPELVQTYLDEIDKTFKRGERSIRRVKLIRPNAGAYAYIHGNRAIILLFHELLPSMTQRVASGQFIPEAAKSLKAEYPDVHIQEAVVVSPQDYNRPSNMAFHVIDQLVVAHSDTVKDLDIHSFVTGSTFMISTDMDKVRQFIDGNSPHSVHPRMDVGFLVHYSEKNTNQTFGPGNNQPFNPNNGDAVSDSTPILAVTAYTDFVKNDEVDGTIRYVPVVRITNIVSQVPMTGMIHLGLALAAEVFIGPSKRWLSQFSSYMKGHPNVGNLSYDAEKRDGSLWFASNQMERNEYLRRNTTAPILVMDIAEGMARLPNLHAFSDSAASNIVVNSAMSFLKTTAPTTSNLVQPLTTEIIAHLGTNTSTMQDAALYDSRYATYLDMVSKKQGAVPPEAADALLSFQRNPMNRISTIEQFYGPARLMYPSTVSLVTQEYVTWVSQAMRSKGFMVSNMAESQTAVSLHSAVQSWANGPNMMATSDARQFGGQNFGQAVYG